MIEEAKAAIIESSQESSVYIGCDSVRFKKQGDWFAKYSTVIILHKNSMNGCVIFHESETRKDYGSLRQRLLTETELAIQAAMHVLEIVDGRHLEIHLDINSDAKHKSNVVVSEALGYVRGMTGLEAKIKPRAFAATHAADHVVRH